MKQKLFNKKKYAVKCQNCHYGRLTPDGESVLCTKNGIMVPEYSCKSYKYDPLKRIPQRERPLMEFDKNDFEL